MTKPQLQRSLGLFTSVSIGVGTMIGAGIFVLAGTSYDMTGPSASLAIFLSGCAALLTALSFAELATIIPASGGPYSYMCEAAGRKLPAFLCGWGFWLGYAMTVGLFALGFGKFIHYFIPAIPQTGAALLMVTYVVFANVRGIGEAGQIQNYATTGLILLMLIFVGYGSLFVSRGTLQPFFAAGTSGVLQTTALLYMTYIGYGLLTHLSEEVMDAEKTIPKAIFISLAIATLVKTGIFLVGAGILPREHLLPAVTDTPLLDVSVAVAGQAGGWLFAAAGILAMLTSINTAVLAASRTSYSLARDRLLPEFLAELHPSYRTPVYSVLLTGLFALLCVLTNDYRYITATSSICFLVGYSQVNVAVILLRKKMPDAPRAYTVPFFPLTPLAGIAVNLLLIVQLLLVDPQSAGMAFVLLLAGAAYFIAFVSALRKKRSRGVFKLQR